MYAQICWDTFWGIDFLSGVCIRRRSISFNLGVRAPALMSGKAPILIFLAKTRNADQSFET